MAKSATGGKIAGAGKKGGTRFPNYSLKDVLVNLKDLASKTHSKPITIEQLNAGVFKVGAKSTMGGIRYSSLKQFGLSEGDHKSITATELARKIALASEEEKIQLIRQAFLNVPPFKNTFETYQGSTVNKTKIKSYSVSPLKVHPDLADKFIESLLESAQVASLCTFNGDEVTFVNANDVEIKTTAFEGSNENGHHDDDFEDAEDADADAENEDDITATHDEFRPAGSAKKSQVNRDLSNIAIQIDSHTDHEKLEKQLKVLRKYGLL